MSETKTKPRKKRKGGPKLAWLLIAKITVDAALQPRANGLDEGAVADYSEAMKAAKGWGDFPAVVVYRDPDGTLWLSEGFHRLAAAADAGLDKVRAEIRDGSRSDAILNAAGSNAKNAVRRTDADKRRAIEMVVDLFPRLSQRELAKIAVVSQTFVSKVKREKSSDGGTEHNAQSHHQNDNSESAADSATVGDQLKTYGNIVPPEDDGNTDAEIVQQAESDAQPEPAVPAPEPPPKSWRDTPVKEAVEFKSRKSAEELATLTCGELVDRLNGGETFGLRNSDLRGLRDRLKEIEEAAAPPTKAAHTTPDEQPPPAPTEHPADAFASRLAKVCRALDDAKAEVVAAAAAAPYGGHVHADSVTLQIEAARKALWQSRPTEACNCVRDGRPPAAACRACFGTGRTTPARVLKGGKVA